MTIAGTSRSKLVFHPVVLAVTKDDSTEHFTFVMTTLCESVLEWEPSIPLAYGFEVNTSTLVAVFSSYVFHDLQNISKC